MRGDAAEERRRSADPIRIAKASILSVGNGPAETRRPDINDKIVDFIGRRRPGGGSPTRYK